MNSYEEGASVQAYLYRLTGKKKRIKIPYYFIFVVGISCKKEKKKKKTNIYYYCENIDNLIHESL